MKIVLLLLLLTCALAAQPAGRERHLRELERQGFRVSRSLPMRTARGLRPSAEIGQRLLALHAVSLWVAAPLERWSDSQVRDYVVRWQLDKALTSEERAILKLSRAEARALHLDNIGWKLENVWSLAWVCGFDMPPAIRGQFSGAPLRRLVFEWLPGPEAAAQERFLKGLQVRPVEQVRELEDYFYCCHNAVRSAQLGGQTVPQDYDPVGEGGAVHERRHALTWCLSPGVSWSDTDLST